VFDLDGLLTEIRTFYSLKEIYTNIEAEMEQCKFLLEDYTQWLGTLLRSSESSKNPEWAKKTAELQKVLKTGKKVGKKEEKNTTTTTEWVQFKDIMLCADDIGEAEILFEVIEELKTKIDKLEKAKNSIADLERYGLGKELLYVTYICEGVPEKIVFKPKKGTGAIEKFEYIAEFPTTKQQEQ
jgi:hypothetical protein